MSQVQGWTLAHRLRASVDGSLRQSPLGTKPMATSGPLILIDGFNLLHAVVLRGGERKQWWSLENQQRVVELVSRFERPDSCWIIFDAARPNSSQLQSASSLVGGSAKAAPQVLYAPSADDRIVEIAARHSGEDVVVVSADRALQDRARNHGSARLSPWMFAEQCSGRPTDR